MNLFATIVEAILALCTMLSFFGAIYYHVAISLEHPNVAFIMLMRSPESLSIRGRDMRRRFLWCVILAVLFAITGAAMFKT
jgi:hypothetical protein